MDTIMTILQWLLPTGVVGSVAAWWLNRAHNELKLIRESHDTFKVMYQDVKGVLQEEVEEKKQLRKTIGRLERALSKMFACKHYAHCPVSEELKQTKNVTARVRSQPNRNGGRQSGDREDPDKEDDTEVETL